MRLSAEDIGAHHGKTSPKHIVFISSLVSSRNLPQIATTVILSDWYRISTLDIGVPANFNLWGEEEWRSPNAAKRQSMRQAYSDEVIS